tara:strand:+ start:328 stop:507 length:180 start_codon:yes stop_codon:yes gene_type:complete
MAIRVFVPDKREAKLNEVLKDLYLLRQAVDFQSGTTDSRLKMIDSIRGKLRTLIEKEDT